MACGSAPDTIQVTASCVSPSGVAVQMEAGINAACDSLATAVDTFRSFYEERWGAVDMAGWVVRIRTTPQRDGDAGLTLHDAKTLDIAVDGFVYLPHELRHVQLGPSSDGHSGWCADYAPWSKAVLGDDEDAYLGCAATK
jgi:hypothetical protein